MSYTNTFGAAALATALSTTAMAQDIQTPEQFEAPTASEQLAEGIFFLNTLIPIETKPLIAGASVTASFRVEANENGHISSLAINLNVENIDCDALGALYSFYGPSEIEKQMMEPADRMAAEGVEQLLVDRHFSLNDTFTKADISVEELQYLGASVDYVPDNVSIRVEASCSDYVAPPPSITPVEPY